MTVRIIKVVLLVYVTILLPSVKPQDVGMPMLGADHDCKDFTCIRKCCPEGELINITSCVPPADEEDLWKPVFYDKDDHEKPVKPPSNVKVVRGFVTCDAFPLTPYVSDDDKFFLLQDGSLYVPLYGKSYGTDKYCIDQFSVSLTEVDEVALLCFETPVVEHSKACKIVKSYVIPLLIMISCVFLFITLAVYICIPELRGKLHGRCLMSMVSSMLTSYIIMAIVYLASEGLPDGSCLACATLKQMTILASFFWLNVMCFDIWRSLKSMRPASETSARSQRRFGLYCLYAWGCPIVIGVVTVVIETSPNLSVNIIRPNFLNGMNACWLNGKASLWVYLYMFILILVLLNILFFCMVAYILIKSQNNQTLQRARSQNRERMWLYGKLFLVMGITWITEIISYQEGTCEVWIVTDIINSLQGFIIFLVFVLKKSTRQMVTRKYSKLWRSMASRVTTSTSGGRRSSTFFTPMGKNSSSKFTESSAVSFSSTTQGVSGVQAKSPNLTRQPVPTIQEADNLVSENSTLKEIEKVSPLGNTDSIAGGGVGGENGHPGDEDCPSIGRESDTSNNDEHPATQISTSNGPTILNGFDANIEGNTPEDMDAGRPQEGANLPNEGTSLINESKRPHHRDVPVQPEPLVNGFSPHLTNEDHSNLYNENPVQKKPSEESTPLMASNKQENSAINGRG